MKRNKTGDFSALKEKAWRLVQHAEKLMDEANKFDEKKSSLHASKQVFEMYGTLLDKFERGADVERLKKKFDTLQKTIEAQSGTAVRRRGGTRSTPKDRITA